MPRLAIISASAVLALAGSLYASPLTLEPLIVNGQSLDGVLGTVTQTNGTARINNSGQWTATFVATDVASGDVGRYVTSYQGILVDPYSTFAFSEGTTLSYVTGAYTAINNHGDIAYGVRGLGFNDSGVPIGIRAGIFTLDGPVVRTGDTNPFGWAYTDTAIRSSQFHLNDQGKLLTNARLGLTIFGGDDAVISFTPQGNGSYSQTVHAAAGQPIADGYVATGTYNARWGSFGLNNSGSVATAATAIGAGGTPEAVHVTDGEIALTSGELPYFGGSYLNLSQTTVAINDHGDHGFFGSLVNEDWDTFRWAVFRNDFELVWIDDGQVEHLEGRNFSNFRSFNMTNGGDLYWMASFDDPLGLTYNGLFRNDELILSSDPNIETATYFPNFTYDISDDGNWLIVESWDAGIYRAYIPSPTSATIFAFGLIASSRRRR